MEIRNHQASTRRACNFPFYVNVEFSGSPSLSIIIEEVIERVWPLVSRSVTISGVIESVDGNEIEMEYSVKWSRVKSGNGD